MTRFFVLNAALGGALFLSSPILAAPVADPDFESRLPDSGHSAPVVAARSYPGDALESLDAQGQWRYRKGATLSRVQTGIRDFAGWQRALNSVFIGRKNGTVELYDWPLASPIQPKRSFAAPEIATLQNADSPLQSVSLASFSLSPDEKLLAVWTIEEAAPTNRRVGVRRELGAKSARLRVFDAQTGEIKWQADPIPSSKRPFESVATALVWRDDTTLGASFGEVGLQFFEGASGKKLDGWAPSPDKMPRVDEAAQAAEDERRNNLLPPDLRGRPRPTRPTGGNANPNASPFGDLLGASGDGRFVVGASSAGIILWDTQSGEGKTLGRATRGGRGAVQNVAFSPEGDLVATWSGRILSLWKLDGTSLGNIVQPLGAPEFSGVQFSVDSRELLTGDTTGTLRFWPTSEAALPKTPAREVRGFWSPWKFLSATNSGVFAATDKHVAVFSTEKSLPKWLETPPIQSEQPLPPNLANSLEIVALVGAPDGKSFAESVSFGSYTTSNQDVARGELRVRDAQTGALKWAQSDFDMFRTVSLLRINGDLLLTGKAGGGRRRAGTTSDDTFVGLQARDLESGELREFPINWGDKVGFRDPGGVEILERSADGSTLLVSSGDGGEGLQIVDLKKREVVNFMFSNTDVSRGPYALSPDGKWLAFGSPTSQKLNILDLESPPEFNGRKPSARDFSFAANSPVRALSWSKNGALGVGLEDGRVLSWASVPSKDAPPTWETAPGRAIVSLDWSDDGQTLWSGDERGDLKIRAAQSGALGSVFRLQAPQTGKTSPEIAAWNR